jgi:hypothetical protein
LTYLYQKVDFIAISRGFHHMKKGVIMRQVEVPLQSYFGVNIDGLVKSLLERHPGESRGPEHLEITGFRLSPE